MDLLGTSSVGDYIPWLAWTNQINGLDAKEENVAKLFDEFLEGVLEEHRDRKKVEKVCDDAGLDFVDILLEFQRENKGGSPVEDDSIKARILPEFSSYSID